MRCVYYRYGSVELYKKDKKAMSRGQLLVFMVSAFWHGFYVGYYISFFFWHQLTALAYCVFRISQNRADLVKKYEESGFAGHLLLWFLVSWAFSYFGATFLLMSSGACIRFMASTYFLPYIAVLVLVFVLQRSPMVRGPRPTAKTE
jgi:lysophospholipid acyltransferase